MSNDCEKFLMDIGAKINDLAADTKQRKFLGKYEKLLNEIKNGVEKFSECHEFKQIYDILSDEHKRIQAEGTGKTEDILLDISNEIIQMIS